MEQVKEDTKKKRRIRFELECINTKSVYTLKCGTIGTVSSLFTLAKSIGFNGVHASFWKRLHKNPDVTLAELALPTVGNKKKPRDKSDVKAAIAALDARKRAMK